MPLATCVWLGGEAVRVWLPVGIVDGDNVGEGVIDDEAESVRDCDCEVDGVTVPVALPLAETVALGVVVTDGVLALEAVLVVVILAVSVLLDVSVALGVSVTVGVAVSLGV